MRLFFQSKRSNLICLIECTVAVILFTIGGLIYVIYRPDSLLMFSWFRWLGLEATVNTLRTAYGDISIYSWVKYSLPAGLWLLSYMLVVDAIWQKSRIPIYYFFIGILPAISILWELFQLLELMPGRFDMIDLLSYIIAILIFVMIKYLV